MHSPPLPHDPTVHVPVVSLSQIYAPGSLILPKYPEPDIDFHPGDAHAFMAGKYAPEIIHSEAARYMSVVGDQVSILLDERTFDPALMDYMEGRYAKFNRSALIGYAEWEHIDAVMEHAQDGTLQTPHPYGSVPSSLYQVPPDVTEYLNDKTNLHRLVDKKYLPRGTVMSPSEVRKYSGKFPIVLKWHSGASGDGVAIVRSPFLLPDALHKFADEPSILVQEYLDIAENRSAQFVIDDDGPKFIGSTTQQTCAAGEYLGNVVQAKEQGIEPQIAPGLVELVTAAYRMGYRGACGIDYVRAQDGRYLILDPNFRLTGATAAILHRNAGLAERADGNIIQVGSFRADMATVGELVEQVGGYGWLYLLSAFAGTGEVRGYAMIVADDTTHAAELAKSLARRHKIILSGTESN